MPWRRSCFDDPSGPRRSSPRKARSAESSITHPGSGSSLMLASTPGRGISSSATSSGTSPVHWPRSDSPAHTTRQVQPPTTTMQWTSPATSSTTTSGCRSWSTTSVLGRPSSLRGRTCGARSRRSRRNSYAIVSSLDERSELSSDVRVCAPADACSLDSPTQYKPARSRAVPQHHESGFGRDRLPTPSNAASIPSSRRRLRRSAGVSAVSSPRSTASSRRRSISAASRSSDFRTRTL